MSLTITIDELILTGFDRVDGQAVRAAVSADLARLAAAGQISTSQASSAVDAGMSSQGLGQSIARAVYHDLRGRPETAAALGGQTTFSTSGPGSAPANPYPGLK